jgi:preprotein translocase subunit SecE
MAKSKSRFSFFTEAAAELRKAHWPTRQEVLRLSIMVIIVCIIIGVLLGALDYGFTKLLTILVIGS